MGYLYFLYIDIEIYSILKTSFQSVLMLWQLLHTTYNTLKSIHYYDYACSSSTNISLLYQTKILFH